MFPTNRPVQRIDEADMIYSTVEGKKKAIVNEVVKRHEKGQPILIGTVTVEKLVVETEIVLESYRCVGFVFFLYLYLFLGFDCLMISRLLRRNGVKHNILNAKNHEREAEIVAQAGRLNAVTIATNMAGRGTDFPWLRLPDEVRRNIFCRSVHDP